MCTLEKRKTYITFFTTQKGMTLSVSAGAVSCGVVLACSTKHVLPERGFKLAIP